MNESTGDHRAWGIRGRGSAMEREHATQLRRVLDSAEAERRRSAELERSLAELREYADTLEAIAAAATVAAVILFVSLLLTVL